MKQNFNTKHYVNYLRDKLGDNCPFSYLLHWQDDEYSKLHFCDYLTSDIVNELKDGWHIIIAVNGEKDNEMFDFTNEDCCLFIQIYKHNNQVYDTCSLLDDEINGMMHYFINAIKYIDF